MGTTKIKELWECYAEDRCSWLVVRFFPIDYIKENVDSLNCYENSYHIAMRLGNDPSFEIRLDDFQCKVFDYLNLMSHFKRTVSDKDAERILFGAIRDIAELTYVTDYVNDYEDNSYYYNHLDTDYCYYNKVSALNFKPIYEIVEKLESVGGANAIEKFKEWDELATTMIQNRYLGAIRYINRQPQESIKSILVNLARHTYWILLTDEQLDYPCVLPIQDFHTLLSSCEKREREFQQLSAQYHIPGYRKWWNDCRAPATNPVVFTNTSENDEGTMAKWKENPQIRYLVEILGLEILNAESDEVCEFPF